MNEGSGACPIGSGPPGDPALLALGWTRRYLADEVQARQAVDLYAAMGLEVITRGLQAQDFGPDCGPCAKTACRTYVMIYTRKTGPA